MNKPRSAKCHENQQTSLKTTANQDLDTRLSGVSINFHQTFSHHSALQKLQVWSNSRGAIYQASDNPQRIILTFQTRGRHKVQALTAYSACRNWIRAMKDSPALPVPMGRAEWKHTTTMISGSRLQRKKRIHCRHLRRLVSNLPLVFTGGHRTNHDCAPEHLVSIITFIFVVSMSVGMQLFALYNHTGELNTSLRFYSLRVPLQVQKEGGVITEVDAHWLDHMTQHFTSGAQLIDGFFHLGDNNGMFHGWKHRPPPQIYSAESRCWPVGFTFTTWSHWLMPETETNFWPFQCSTYSLLWSLICTVC